MNQIGPSPPPGFKTDVATADEEGTSEEVIGPKLPPHSTKNQADVSGIGESSCPDYPVPNTYGPTLPPGFLPHETSSREEEELEEDAVIGPMPSTGEVTVGIWEHLGWVGGGRGKKATMANVAIHFSATSPSATLTVFPTMKQHREKKRGGGGKKN